MIDIEAIEKLSKKYSNSPIEFIKLGSTLAIKEKKPIFSLSGLKFLPDMKLQLLRN